MIGGKEVEIWVVDGSWIYVEMGTPSKAMGLTLEGESFAGSGHSLRYEATIPQRASLTFGF